LPAFIRGLLEGIHARVEAAVEHGGDGLAIRLGGGHLLVDALDGDFQRLLADHVLAGIQGRERRIEV
jgi:hypothetical protein